MPATTIREAEIKMLISEKNLDAAKQKLNVKSGGKPEVRVCFFDTPDRILDKKLLIIRVRLEEKGDKKDVDATVKLRGAKVPPPGFETMAPESDWVAPDRSKDSYQIKQEDLDAAEMREVLAGTRPVKKVLTDEQEALAKAVLGQPVPWAELKRYGVIDAWKSKEALSPDQKVTVDYWRLSRPGKETKELLEISLKTRGTPAEIAEAARKFYAAAEAAGLGKPSGKSKTEEVLSFYEPGH